MTSNRFFIKRAKFDSSYVYLDGEEHHHLSRVARIKPNDKVWLFDKQGMSYLVRVEEIKKEKTRLFIIKKRKGKEPKVKITLAQALLRSKKMEFILQRATEWGITTFIPVMTSRSIIKIKEKAEKRIERWQKVAREATKQSQRAHFPLIVPPMPLARLLEERDEERKLLLSENRGKNLKDILISKDHTPKSPSSVIVLIGPEGGWSEEEERDIMNHDYEAISLGNQILRAETAALSSIAMISHFWNS